MNIKPEQYAGKPGSAWLRGMLVALLLFAQHGALTHALAHAVRQSHGGSAAVLAGTAAPSHQGTLRSGSMPAEQATKMCAFDLAYSQVLGAITAAIAGFAPLSGVDCRRAARHRTRIVTALPPFQAQAPPALL